MLQEERPSNTVQVAPCRSMCRDSWKGLHPGMACHSSSGLGLWALMFGWGGFPVRPMMFWDEYLWLTKFDLEINAILKVFICI